MIIDNIQNILNINYDIIIIGSGPAGISVVLNLKESNLKTLIIEAGNLDPSLQVENFLSGKVLNDKYPKLEYLRARQFGGTSSLWGGNCNLMEDTDFNNWPINKTDLDRYINPAKKILNLKKKFFSEEIDKNIDILNLQWSNVNFLNYLDFFKDSKNHDLILNTSFLHFNGKNGMIKSATVFNSKKYILKSKKFILACGGIENSRLLEWSRKKNRNLINSQMPIGKYFMDHPYYHVGSGVIKVNKLKLLLKEKVPELNLILECERSLHLSPSKNFLKFEEIKDLKLQLKFKDLSNSFKRQLICVAPKYFQSLILKGELKDLSEIEIYVIHEQKPYINNRIELDNLDDPYGTPKIKLNWNFPEENFSYLEKFLIELSKFFIKYDLGRLSIENYKTKNIILGNHQLGGTRIGINSSDSVVDRNLKVHEIKNLYISGSSVFRTGSHAHPTFTIVQLSSRLADHLKNIN